MNSFDMTPCNRILVVDDNTAIHEDFKKILAPPSGADDDLQDMEALLFGSASQTTSSIDFAMDFASQGEEALELVRGAKAENRPYSLAFVDGRMPPGWDGIETIRHLWDECPDLQVVLCTAYADYSWHEIQNILGESDSLLILKKPFDNVEVLQLAHALTKKWELKQEVQGRLNQLAYYDGLTGLPNRTLFMDRLTQALNHAIRYNKQGALLFIDLDNFKRINDTLGHSIGDRLLKAISERLVKSLRSSDTVARPTNEETAARLGGDEFTVILPALANEKDAGMVARRIEKNFAQPMNIGNHQFFVTSSIGVAIFPQDGDNIETLLKNADLAMYFAKNGGPSTFKYYQESMNAAALKRLTMENQLRQASKRNEFTLHYQPQFDLANGRLSGMEALLRWHNNELGDVSPSDFIPIAEESGMIIEIGEWVLRTACRQVCQWDEQGLSIGRIAVNVSIKQFTHPDFLKMVGDILAETGFSPHRLEIEITESLLVDDTKGIKRILKALKEMNVRIAVDDFGTGYSSLGRLKEMPIDCLKIDRSFICEIDSGNSSRSIVGAIIAMAEGLDLSVIAEGVETNHQVDFLVDKQCLAAQGFFFSQPLSAFHAKEFLHKALKLHKIV